MARTQPNSARRYDSSGRRARATQSQRQVLETASTLFVANGYAATTIAAVAKAANVSQPTIFAAFGTKAGLLKRCIEVAFAGDDEDVPVADRPLAQWVYDTDDAHEVLRRYAVMMGVVARRSGLIYDVLVRAADAEPELAELLADFERQRLRVRAWSSRPSKLVVVSPRECRPTRRGTWCGCSTRLSCMPRSPESAGGRSVGTRPGHAARSSDS